MTSTASSTSTEPPINTVFTNLTSYPSHPQALRLLQDLAEEVRPLLRHHHFQINSLSEFYAEADPSLNSASVLSPTGHGHDVFIRLRCSEDSTRFRPLGVIVDAFLHELPYMRPGGEGGARFVDQLRREYTGSREYDGVVGCVNLRVRNPRASARQQLNGVSSRGPARSATTASTSRYPSSTAPRSLVNGHGPRPSIRPSTSSVSPSTLPRNTAAMSGVPFRAQFPPSASPGNMAGLRVVSPPVVYPFGDSGIAVDARTGEIRRPQQTGHIAEAIDESAYRRPRSRTTSVASSRHERDIPVYMYGTSRLDNPPLFYSRRSSRRSTSRASTSHRSRHEDPQNVSIQNVNVYNFGNGASSAHIEHGPSTLGRSRQRVTITEGGMSNRGMMPTSVPTESGRSRRPRARSVSTSSASSTFSGYTSY